MLKPYVTLISSGTSGTSGNSITVKQVKKLQKDLGPVKQRVLAIKRHKKLIA